MKKIITFILLMFVFVSFNTYAVEISCAQDVFILGQLSPITPQTTLRNFNLVITQTGGGQGNVTRWPNLIKGATSCGAGCTSYPLGTTITLTATPAQCSSFSGWGGSCSGIAPKCTLMMKGNRTVTATFTPLTATYQPDRSVERPMCDECYYCKAVVRGTSIYCQFGTMPQGVILNWTRDCNEVANWCRKPENRQLPIYPILCER